ncbi:DUF2252 domain-containing protein [Synechococcales cyanobacterium C]|uniref:DUF2252 domain-containing protein n=1 Tax=Petrachloros mirabilis ULC683 TaxID=2781853 RepID=A0A8K2A811_9CYAN|nr:DUF2252 domain-containing protein [Petrachloros mirabilis]NCJ07504.1 DUF2252 domain-containing protein [Petrachloros mirabilis ULC683]
MSSTRLFPQVQLGLSRSDRIETGKALRKQVPRSSHRDWQPAPHRPDPVDLIELSNQGRAPELIPLRHARMMVSPFTFFRGTALIMATDMASLPTTGLRVESCGDCHLMNFGGFATPERNLIFDLNDFDETLPAPWEWDIKRLSASLVIAGQDLELSDKHCHRAARNAAQAYRQSMRDYSQQRALEVWYARLNAETLLEHAPSDEIHHHWQRMLSRADNRTLEQAFDSLTEVVNGQRRFREEPPLFYHPPDFETYFASLSELFEQYRDTLLDNHQFLLDRYQLVDVAIRVVGVGSVGTHCGVALLMADDHDPLLLQYKEARPSVLEPYVGKSPYDHEGQRIVSGQRLVQAASDMLLGWTSDRTGRDFYFRQLRDMKTSIRLKGMSARGLADYGEICGSTLALAHARSGDPAMMAGYLGKGDIFDRAIADFALTYASQNQQDYQAMQQAVKSGRLEARPEDG